MTLTAINRSLGVLALLAALSVGGILAAGLQAGISQEPFQIARTSAENLVKLMTNPQGLRFNIGFDNAFIVFYVSFFVLLTHRLKGLVPDEVRYVALFGSLLGALLDASENQHILAMLFSAEHGLAISTEESQIQMLASNLKFHIVYVSTFLFAFGLARLGALGTFIALGVWFVFLPLGLAIYVVPPEMTRPLIILRGLFFLSSFVLMALLFLTGPKASATET
jgi:hypothetical protein